MSSKCPGCGGSVIFDIATQKVKCEHCSTSYEPETFGEGTLAEERGQYTTTVFGCPNCGAEISSTEFDAVDYCLYCGSFVTLDSQMKSIKRPDYIIPFSKAKEDCTKAYRKALRRKLYAPREFRKAEFIDGFRGVYVPYWDFEYEYGPDVTVKGRHVYTKGNYEYKQDYNATCKVKGKVDNVAYDASSTFDDEISMSIAPFQPKHMKPFSTAYMFGFYGDTADIDPKLYQEESDEGIRPKIWDSVAKDQALKKAYPDMELSQSVDRDFQVKKKNSIALLPVWFLTWRNGNRIAYSVMNGDNGKLYTEIPIDIKKYVVFSILSALLLYMFFSAGSVALNVYDMLFWAVAFAFFVIVNYVLQLERIVRKVMHTDDRGFLSKHEQEKKESDEKVTDNFYFTLVRDIWNTLKNESLIALIVIAALVAFFGQFVMLGVGILALIFPIYTIYRVGKNADILKDQTVWIDIAGCLITIVISALVWLLDPAPDIPYYCVGIFCVLSVCFAAVRMVKRYNQLLTRPVPHFFTKKGGAK